MSSCVHAGRHCEKGTHQDPWFLNNCQQHIKVCMQISYIYSGRSIFGCVLAIAGVTLARSSIHKKPSPATSLRVCLFTVVLKPERSTIVRWLVTFSRQGWIIRDAFLSVIFFVSSIFASLALIRVALGCYDHSPVALWLSDVLLTGYLAHAHLFF